VGRIVRFHLGGLAAGKGALVVKAIEALVAPLQERQREEALAARQARDAEAPEDAGGM